MKAGVSCADGERVLSAGTSSGLVRTSLEQPASRPLTRAGSLLLPLLAMAGLLCWPPERLDFYLSRFFHHPPAGFFLRHEFWLERVLHDGVRQVAALGAVGLLLCLAGSFLHPGARAWRRPLLYLVLAIALSTASMPFFKSATKVYCPQQLEEFGGVQPYVPLLAPVAAPHDTGRCWPGGHAATAFSLFALYFVLRDRRPRQARWVLRAVLAGGAVLSAAQIMRGEHFFSHNLWTMLIDWTICLLLYRLLLYRPQAPGRSG